MDRQFYFYQSNRLETLNILISAIMQTDPLPSPFDSEKIIVQSHGMSQWLNLALTEQFDVVANLKVSFVGQAIWSLYQSILSELPHKNELSIEKMSWMLLSVLAKNSAAPELLFIKNQIDLQDQKQRLQFALSIAHLFDQYLIYRPDWLISWENNQMIADLGESDQIWQAYLWRQLLSYSQQLKQPLSDRLSIHLKALNQLKMAKKLNLTRFPKRIMIFGVTSLPPLFLDFFYELSRFVPIHFFHIMPSKAYLIDAHKKSALIEAQNPLLASWCAVGREFQTKLLDYPDIQQENLFIQQSADQTEKTLKLSLLNQVQTLILNNENPAQKSVIDQYDDSIQIAPCYTPLREVEALYDYLLTQFEQNRTLTLNDCVVMTPNIDLYAPYIEAVFNNAPKERALPYAISDRKYASLDPIVTGFSQLLNLPKQTLNLSYLFDLLTLKPILEQFDLAETELESLQYWFVDSGTIWGFDELASYSLDSGIDRMLLGYTMKSEHTLWNNFAPYEEIQGSNAITLGKIARFIQCLKEWQLKLNQPYSIQDWQTVLTQLLEAFFHFQGNLEREQTKTDLLIQFSRLAEEIEQTEFNELIRQDVIQQTLQERISDHYISNRFLIGKINFCTLMPMRNVPFKVIAILGLNDKDFPRQVTLPSFNLMTKQPRLNDRNRRKDDRYLFLEALCSAENKLYLSYIGRNIKTDEALFPSVLVTELMDFIVSNFKLAHSALSSQTDSTQTDSEQEKHEQTQIKQHLILKQTRMPYDIKLFQKQSSQRKQSDRFLLSFAKQWQEALLKQHQNKPFLTSIKPMQIKEIDLQALITFFKHPIKAFLQNRLAIHYWADEFVLPEAECFELETLANYNLKNNLLQKRLSTHSLSDLSSDWLSRSNQIPQGLFGELILSKIEADILPMQQKIQAQIGLSSFESVNQIFELSLDDEPEKTTMLHCQTDKVIDQKLLHFKVGNLNNKDKLELALTLLACIAAGQTLKGALFVDKNASLFELKAITQTEALELLKTWVRLYIQGLNAPLFMPLDIFKKEAKTGELASTEAMLATFVKDDAYTIKPSYDLLYKLVYPSVQDLPFDEDLMQKQALFFQLLEMLACEDEKKRISKKE